jgi:hypothetical protein
MNAADARAPLIQGVSQYEVDFVIPRAGIDVPVGIDPFLLFKIGQKNSWVSSGSGSLPSE